MEVEKNKTFRNYLCTLNNPVMTLSEIHDKSNAVYTVGQMEVGESGTRHLQFFQNFKKGVRGSMYKKIDAGIHYDGVAINNGAHTYCMKEETRVDGPWEYGIKPVQRNNATDWADVKLKAKTGRMEEVPDDIYIKYYSTLKKIAKDNLLLEDSSELRGFWIYGYAGCGKSSMVRREHPGAYPKARNQWWDGYNGEDVVVMDDVDKYDVKLAGYLKDWGDRYGKILENKGSAMVDNWTKFIVTSQYSIDEIWEDEQTRDALHRRYKTIHFNATGQIKVYDRKTVQTGDWEIGEKYIQ